jgi:hypothetical protein
MIFIKFENIFSLVKQDLKVNRKVNLMIPEKMLLAHKAQKEVNKVT